MSLTQRIKHESSREYTASDGTTYILQRVDMQELFITEGLLPDLTAILLEDDNNEGKPLDTEELKEKAMREILRNPGLAMRGARTAKMMLERGLIGEKTPDGGILIYRHVDKPAILLGEGEVNVALISPELQSELVEAIMALTPKPKVGGPRFQGIPEQKQSAAGGADSAGTGNTHAPERADLG
jgi:hypothetical protein